MATLDYIRANINNYKDLTELANAVIEDYKDTLFRAVCNDLLSINNCKQDIKDAIDEKGGEIYNSTPLADYADIIRTLGSAEFQDGMKAAYWTYGGVGAKKMLEDYRPKTTVFDYFYYNNTSDLTSLDFSKWDAKVTSAKNFFYNAKNLKTINLGGWDTTELTNANASGMFTNASFLRTLDLSKWALNSYTWSTTYPMFSGATRLNSVKVNDCEAGTIDKLRSALQYNVNTFTYREYTKTDESGVETTDKYLLRVNRANEGMPQIHIKHKSTKSQPYITLWPMGGQDVIRNGSNTATSNVSVANAAASYGQSTASTHGATCYATYSRDARMNTNNSSWYNEDSGWLEFPFIGVNVSYANSAYSVSAWYYGLDPVKDVYGLLNNLNGNTTTGVSYHDNTMITNVRIVNTDFSEVTRMQSMFYCLTNLEEIDDTVRDLNPIKCTNFQAVFAYCLSLPEITLNWSTPEAKNMSYLFRNCSSAKSISFPNFDTSNVTTMNSMFESCKSMENYDFLKDIKGWDTSNVTNMGVMFYGGSGVLDHLDVAGWNVEKVTNISQFCNRNPQMKWVDFSGWDLKAMATPATYATSMFNNNTSMEYIKVKDASDKTKAYIGYGLRNSSGITNKEWGLTQDGNYFKKITDDNKDELQSFKYNLNGGTLTYKMYALNCDNTAISYPAESSPEIIHMPLGGGRFSIQNNSYITNFELNTLNTKGMSSMYLFLCDSANIETIDLTGIDTSSVETLSCAFSSNPKLTTIKGIGSFDTSKVTNMYSVFNADKELVIDEDITNWDTSKVTTMNYMFANCDKFKPQPFKWDCSSVTYMSQMFNDVDSEDFTHFDGSGMKVTNKLVDVSNMFNSCDYLRSLDLSGWDMSGITSYGSWFSNTGIKWIKVEGCNDASKAKVGAYIGTNYWYYSDNTTTPQVKATSSTGDDNDYIILNSMYPLTLDGTPYSGTVYVRPNGATYYSTAVRRCTVSMANTSALAYYFAGGTSSSSDTTAERNAFPRVDASNINLASSTATSLAYTFANCASLEQIDGLENWDTSKITSMAHTFEADTKLKLGDSILDWDTSKVTSMYGTFFNNDSYDTPALPWDCSNVTTMYQMYYDVDNIKHFDGTKMTVTSKLTNVGYMFNSCNNLESLDLSGWDLSGITSYSNWFGNTPIKWIKVEGCNDASKAKVGAYLGTGYWYYADNAETPLVKTTETTDDDNDYIIPNGMYPLNMDGTPYTGTLYIRRNNAKYYTTGFIRASVNYNTANELYNYFAGGYSGDSDNTTERNAFPRIDVSRVKLGSITNIHGIFSNNGSLQQVDGIENWDTSKVTDMGYMFQNCSALTTLDVSGWDTSSVTNMRLMFNDCSQLTSLDVSGWDTSSVTGMGGMFYGCNSLTTLDVSGWDTSSVTGMGGMFCSCNSLTTLDVSGWDTSKVTDMSYLFQSNYKLKEFIAPNFKGTNTTIANNMFQENSVITRIELPNWDTPILTNAYQMFYNCYKLEYLDFSNFNSVKITTYGDMFTGCSALTKVKVANCSASTKTWLIARLKNAGYTFTEQTIDGEAYLVKS